jgi:hypothetical protein
MGRLSQVSSTILQGQSHMLNRVKSGFVCKAYICKSGSFKFLSTCSLHLI